LLLADEIGQSDSVIIAVFLEGHGDTRVADVSCGEAKCRHARISRARPD
jgi:hypothetical protein